MDMAIVLHDGLCGPTRHRSAMSFLMILADNWESPRFLSLFLALADSRFEGESILLPQAGNAHR